MASPQVGSVATKLSFAKVAAMNAPNVVIATPNIPDDKQGQPKESTSRGKQSSGARLQSPTPPTKSIPQPDTEEVSNTSIDINHAAGAIEGLSLVQNASTTANGARSAESGESLEDDQSHLSNSSLKQQSLETKSMASVTTFAMDEKESIRPDDSASVRATDDDEPITSLSRNATFSSEPEVIMPSLRGGARQSAPGLTIMAARRFHTLTNPPRFGDLPVSPVIEAEDANQAESTVPSEVGEANRMRMPSLPVSPDEKLLDALATPKDRLPLLQLEEKLLAFIGQSSVDFMDLPPQNSFARLLGHKLADYYNLAHHINEDGTSIRIFRTPSVTLPMPLAILARSIPIGSVQPPGATAMKIMRRAGLGGRQLSAGGSTAASSSVPSKATSEAGLETNSDEGLMSPADGTPSRDKSKLTREEREAQYKAARERIFGDFQEPLPSESVSTGENSANISRSSSSSGKRKSRKQRTPKDDSFEARSAFVPSYGHMQIPPMQNQYQPQPVEQPYQNPYGSPPGGYNLAMTYGTTPTQAYPGYDQAMQFNSSMTFGSSGPQPYASPDAWSGMQSPPPGGYFSYPQPSPGYQQNVSPMLTQMNNQYMPQAGANTQQSQGWTNNQFQNQYSQQVNPQSSGINSWPGYPPYQHGQLPGQTLGGNIPYNVQPHPVPGSFNNTNNNRSLFNPQTRSFVPNNAPSRTGGRNNRKKNSPPGGHIRNANSTPKAFGSDSSGNTALLSPRGLDLSSSTSSSPKPTEDSLQQKYGAPAHLPKKPPPSQVTSSFEVDRMPNVAANARPTVNNGGNGVVPSPSSTA